MSARDDFAPDVSYLRNGPDDDADQRIEDEFARWEGEMRQAALAAEMFADGPYERVVWDPRTPDAA